MADRPPPPPPGPGGSQYPYGYDQSAYYASYYGQQPGGWQQQQQYGAWQQQQQAPPPPPPEQPPLPPGEPPPPPPPGGAQQQGQQAQQEAQQQQGYGWQGDYSAYYQQAYAPSQQAYGQHPAYQQQWPGYSAPPYYQQQGYQGHPSGHPPPPQRPPPPSAASSYAGGRGGSGYGQPQAAQQSAANGTQQPAWKAAADRVAAAAAAGGSSAAAAQQQQQYQYQQAQQAQQQQSYSPDGYNAVPPPSALSGMTAAASGAYGGGGQRAFSIRPQAPKPKQPQPVNPIVAAFNQAASQITAGAPAGAQAAPAYTRVSVSPAAPQGLAPQQQQAAVPPQQWPPALKAYVERAFTASDARQRPKLQEVLKKVIGDAQASGELWTRDWDAMPLPDLSQTAADAAAVLAEVAAVSGPAAGQAGYAGRGSRWASQQQQQQQPQQAGQSPYAAAQQYAAAQAQKYQQQQQQYGQSQYAAQQRQMKQQQRQPKKWAQKQRVDLEEERYGRRGRKRSWRDDRSDSSRSSDSEDGWSYAERQRRQRRAGRFADTGGGKGGSGGWRADERRQRLMAMLEEGGDDEDVDWDALAIKGTCQELEKSYFRLTSAPDPATVRPEAVLRTAVERLVGLLRERRVNYFYAVDQFKGMRQDCTVQHIRNDLAVQVYEAHARAALEYGDVAEYNQCQSQLRVLYNEGVPGSKEEFLAYRIIYQAVHVRHGEILQLLNTLKKVKREEAALPAVSHALAVRAALASADYQAFFRLYASAPALGRALMDIYVPKLRFDALTVVVKAFKPSVPVPFLASMLGFVAPAARAAPAVQANAGGSPAGGEGRGKSPSAEGESGAVAAAAGPADGPPSTAAAAAGPAAALAEPDGGAAAAAGGGAADGPAGSGPQEPPPGCMETYFVGDYAGQANEVQGWQDCLAWLAECGAVVTDGDTPADATLDCKASTGQLKMPEEKDKVAHGDENLRVEDFFKGFT